VTNKIPATGIEIGHLLAGKDLAEAHRGLARAVDDATVVDVTECRDGRLAIHLERGRIYRQPSDEVEVVQDVAPSAELAAALPAGWRLVGATIAEYWAEPAAVHSLAAQVLPGLGRRWHAHVGLPGRTLLCERDAVSAADAFARATNAMTETAA